MFGNKSKSNRYIEDEKKIDRLIHTDLMCPKMFEYEHNQDDVYSDLIQSIVQTI